MSAPQESVAVGWVRFSSQMSIEEEAVAKIGSFRWWSTELKPAAPVYTCTGYSQQTLTKGNTSLVVESHSLMSLSDEQEINRPLTV